MEPSYDPILKIFGFCLGASPEAKGSHQNLHQYASGESLAESSSRAWWAAWVSLKIKGAKQMVKVSLLQPLVVTMHEVGLYIFMVA